MSSAAPSRSREPNPANQKTAKRPGTPWPRIPRWGWLLLSALTLVTGSIFWWVLSPPWNRAGAMNASTTAWWNKPWMAESDAVLPDISARLLAVAVQPAQTDNPRRVWIAGARGFLAYSEDEGRCWTPYKYFSDAKPPEFRS